MKLIKSEKEHNQALNRLNIIFDAVPNSKEGEEAELMALLIEEHEEENYKIETPDSITAIKIRMEELELKQKDLVGIIGSKGIVSEVLNKKRRLTEGMIRNLLKESDYKKLRKKRYSSFDKGHGKAFENGDLKLTDLHQLAIANGEPKQISRQQELFENIINNHI